MKVELVGVPLAMDFGHNVFVIVISTKIQKENTLTKIPFFLEFFVHWPQCSAELVIIHVGFRFSFPPTSSHFIWISELELPIGTLPSNNVGVGCIGKELQKELPELDLPWSLGDQASGSGGQECVGVRNSWKKNDTFFGVYSRNWSSFIFFVTLDFQIVCKHFLDSFVGTF